MIINLTNKRVIARRPKTALGFIERGIGMIGRDFSDFDAMVFHNCNAVHTMLMRIKIDILFVDGENRICEIRKRLVPWVPVVRSANAVTVVELPEGIIEETATELGHILDLNAELTEEAIKEPEQQLMPAPDAVISMNEKVI